MMRRAAVSSVSLLVPCAQQGRHISTRGQYNPIHSFDVTHDNMRATSFEQFRALTDNPGPINVSYSVDYLDWYFRAYNEKVRFVDEKAKKNEKFPEGAAFSDLKFQRPRTSTVRAEGEKLKSTSQTAIEKCSIQQGMFDLYERQGQFPAIHIEKCTDYHIREILRSMFFEGETSATHLWELALLYRALIQERNKSYPQSFGYIVEAAQTDLLEEKTENSATSPTKDMQAYYTYLVKKYHIDNAGEAHVVLRCLGEADQSQLLLSVPAPLEDEEGTVPPTRPESFPPLKAMLNSENMNLARCLIFGEFNAVADADPFEKFPNALSHVTRPRNEELHNARRAGSGIALAITEKRGKFFADLTAAQKIAADARGKDAQRLQSNAAARDGKFGKELEKKAEENPGAFQSDNAFYNPRAIRSDLRDTVSRKMIQGLRKYEEGKNLTTRDSLLSYDSCRRARVVTKDATALPTKASVAHFSALLLGDRHISFLASTSASEELTSSVSFAARQMFKMAVEYLDSTNRFVNRKKLDVALAVLDDLVENGLKDSPLEAEVQALGTYVPWSKRHLSEAGYPTPARVDDYQRWMAATSVKATPST